MDVTLRELSRGDMETVNRWRCDESVIASLASAFRYVSREVDERWFDEYLSRRMFDIRLAICVSDQTEPIGVVYLLGIDWVSRSGEFAILVGEPDYQGRGVGEIATRKMIDHGFLDLNLHRIYLTVLAENTNAIELYKKVGFVEEGRLREAVFKGGNYVDLLQMGLLASKYTMGDASER